METIKTSFGAYSKTIKKIESGDRIVGLWNLNSTPIVTVSSKDKPLIMMTIIS